MKIPAAVIFDLDGTLIDNNAYHIEAWKAFYAKHGFVFSHEEYKNTINGKINRDIFPLIFGRQVSATDIDAYTEEKEALYRELYAPHIAPVPGLIDFLEELSAAGIPLAIATSGIPVNINFMFEHVAIQKYFDAVIDSNNVVNGKPHPEIFLKAAAKLNADPLFCTAFEDSVSGVRSAKAAMMKVIALTTTHTKEDLHEADKIITDYTTINFNRLQQLMRS
ncbi:MAG TPA: HAD family phosphatase [Chitinophagaceae bacterium]|nr:HAD family phosphatase [Chitinophagaceae bacterium]